MYGPGTVLNCIGDHRHVCDSISNLSTVLKCLTQMLGSRNCAQGCAQAGCLVCHLVNFNDINLLWKHKIMLFVFTFDINFKIKAHVVNKLSSRSESTGGLTSWAFQPYTVQITLSQLEGHRPRGTLYWCFAPLIPEHLEVVGQWLECLPTALCSQP